MEWGLKPEKNVFFWRRNIPQENGAKAIFIDKFSPRHYNVSYLSTFLL